MRRQLWSVVLAMGLVVGVLAAVGQVAGADSTDRIAFESDRSGNLDIWTMLGDGSALTQITTHPARDSEADWSPDRTKIAFSSWRAGGGNSDIWVIDVETGDLWQITSGAADEIAPSWSPDGMRLAYWHGYTTVYVVDVSDLSNPGTPLPLTTKHAMSPDWCVNGYIAFQSNHGHWGVYSIWAKNPDTSDEYEVVQYVGGAGAYSPAWSPDGLELAYENLQSGNSSIHNNDIYVAAKDDPLPNLGEQITSDSVVAHAGVADSNPAWSPSGGHIYFTRWVYDVGQHDIFVVNRDGSGVTNLTNRPEGRDSQPTITTQCTYQWLGFIPPLADDSRRVFKRGSTVPVKFRIADCAGNPVSDAVATLTAYYHGEGAPSGEAEVVSTAAGDWGDQFRYDAEDDLYIFNLSTKRCEWLDWMAYLIVVTLDDGQEFTQTFSLK